VALAACGPGDIPGDPEAIRALADALERGSRDAEEIADLIRLAGATALEGWDAPSAQGYEAFCAEALTCAHGLIDVGPAAAAPLRAYASELEAAQRAFAGAVADERSAERGLDSAERGSRAEHAAQDDLDDARGAKASAYEAALAANERAAHQIEAIADSVPAAPAAPVPPVAPEQAGPWYEDFAAWELEQGIGFVRGVGEGVVGIGEGLAMLYRLSPANALLDTDSFLEQWSDLGRAAVYASQNPGEFVKAVVNWEDLSAGRYGEWLGNLAPDAVLAIGTAGAGTVASRGLRGAKALEDVAEVAPGAKRLEGARPAVLPSPPAGRWVPEPGSKGFSESARRYQELNGGRAGEAFRVERGGKRADFDSYDGPTLIDSKDRYDQFFDKRGEPKGWWRGRHSMLDTAKRQVEVAGEHPVEWRFNHRGPAMDWVQEQFARDGIPIRVRHVPMDPGG